MARKKAKITEGIDLCERKKIEKKRKRKKITAHGPYSLGNLT